MSKKKSSKKGVTPKAPKKQAQSQKSSKKSSGKGPNLFGVNPLKNFGAAAVVIILFFVATNGKPEFKRGPDGKVQKAWNVGYQWLFGQMIPGALETPDKYGELTHEQRLEGKLGFDYRFCNYINENTPLDAVILFPPDSIIQQKGADGKKSDFSYSMTGKGWIAYWIYPRKVWMSKDTIGTYRDSITHVAVMNYWGYDQVPYKVGTKSKHTIIPMEAPTTPAPPTENNGGEEDGEEIKEEGGQE